MRIPKGFAIVGIGLVLLQLIIPINGGFQPFVRREDDTIQSSPSPSKLPRIVLMSPSDDEPIMPIRGSPQNLGEKNITASLIDNNHNRSYIDIMCIPLYTSYEFIQQNGPITWQVISAYFETVITFIDKLNEDAKRVCIIITVILIIVTITLRIVKQYFGLFACCRQKQKIVTPLQQSSHVNNVLPIQHNGEIAFNPQTIGIKFLPGDDYKTLNNSHQKDVSREQELAQLATQLNDESSSASNKPQLFQKMIDLLAARPNVETLIADGMQYCPKLKIPVNSSKSLSYEELKKIAKPLDIIGVRSTESTFTNFISFIQHKSRSCELLSHLDIIVTRDVVDAEEMEPGELYVMSSIWSGINSDPIKDIYKNAFAGVQIRSLRELLEYSYKHTPKIVWWHCPLKPQYRAAVDACLRGDCIKSSALKSSSLFGKLMWWRQSSACESNCSSNECPLRHTIVSIYGTPYPMGPSRFMAGLLPFGVNSDTWWWNGLNKLMPTYMSGYTNDETNAMFCSEMVIHILCSVKGVLNEEYKKHARRFYPVDILIDHGGSSDIAGAKPHELIECMNLISAHGRQ